MRKLFTYPDFGTPCGQPEHKAHSGQVVNVLRLVGKHEETGEEIFLIRAADGWQGEANASELSDPEYKIIPGHADMHEVTQDAWAEHLVGLRTVQSEGTFSAGHSVMYSRLVDSADARCVAEVHYLPNGLRAYFIR